MQSKQWQAGDKHLINKLTWGKPEVDNVMDVLKGDWFGAGEYNKKFEAKLAGFSGRKHAQTTNSGSAAIQLTIQSLMQRRELKPGDKILHPMGTFATSISSSIMAGLIPVYVDIGEGTYVINTDAIKAAFQEHEIKAAVIPALLGNVPDLDVLLEALDGKPLILDSCDVMGSKWQGREVASYGRFGCFSFYGSHHISTFGVGGGVVCDDDEDYRLLNSQTFWGRDFTTDERPLAENLLSRYTYSTLGLDAQMTNVQAAFGLAQFDRLDGYVTKRRELFERLQKQLSKFQRWFILPTRTSDKADVSWFSYPLTIKPNAPFTRREMVAWLVENGVEVRPVMSPMIIDNLAFRNQKFLVTGEFPNCKQVKESGFFMPACPMEDEQQTQYVDIIGEFLYEQTKKEKK